MSYNTIGWEDYPSTKTPITAANLKHMDEQIKDNADNLETLMNKTETIISGILSTGNTSLSFTNDAITDTCFVNVYTKPYWPIKSISQTDTTITATFKAATADITVKLVISEK